MNLLDIAVLAVLVLFVLPQILVWGDGFIMRTTLRNKRRLRPLFSEDIEQIAQKQRGTSEK